MGKVFCPNEKCSHYENPEPKNFLKKGKTKGFKGRTYQRFQCKSCGLKFSSRKLKWESEFKDTEILYDIFSRYTGGTTIQRISDDLDLDKKTVIKSIHFLGKKIANYHYHSLAQKQIRTETVAFDEMESYVQARNLPVSIGIAVCGATQKIIDVRVATIRLRGKRKTKVERLHNLKRIRLSPEYFTREDNSREMCRQVLLSVQQCLPDSASITTDDKRGYITLIREILPTARHYRIKSKKSRSTKKKATKKRAYRKKTLPRVPDEQKLTLHRLNSVQGSSNLFLSSPSEN